MKTKLTLTVEKLVVKEAKQYAYGLHSSLSQIVEEALTARLAEVKEPMGNRWRGRLRMTAKKDARSKYLKKRHT